MSIVATVLLFFMYCEKYKIPVWILIINSYKFYLKYNLVFNYFHISLNKLNTNGKYCCLNSSYKLFIYLHVKPVYFGLPFITMKWNFKLNRFPFHRYGVFLHQLKKSPRLGPEWCTFWEHANRSPVCLQIFFPSKR